MACRWWPDPLPDYPGPLAGVLAALDWAAAHRPEIATVLSVPGDGPFLPPDLAARLQAARAAAGVPMACAASGGWTHPPIALWPVALRGELRAALLAGENEDRPLDRPLRLRRGGMADRPHRPLLQRQCAGGPGGGRGPLACRLPRTHRLSGIA